MSPYAYPPRKANASDLEIPETWQTHPDYPRYEVSTLGRIRSGYHDPPLLLRLQMGSSGYLTTRLHHQGIPHNVTVHSAVLRTFVGPPPPGQECRHLNGDKHDNRLSNVRWGTHRQNVADMRQHGTMAIGARNGQARLGNAKVLELRMLRSQGAEYRVLAETYGVSPGAVWSAVTGASYPQLPGAQPRTRRPKRRMVTS